MLLLLSRTIRALRRSACMTHSRPIRSLRTPFRKGAHARRPWPNNGLARRAAAAELGGILPHATHAIGGGPKKGSGGRRRRRRRRRA